MTNLDVDLSQWYARNEDGLNYRTPSRPLFGSPRHQSRPRQTGGEVMARVVSEGLVTAPLGRASGWLSAPTTHRWDLRGLTAVGSQRGTLRYDFGSHVNSYQVSCPCPGTAELSLKRKADGEPLWFAMLRAQYRPAYSAGL